jgi:hypothetical protein
MSEAPPDIKALARRYLDLWQEQVAAMANDPALADALAQSVAMVAQLPAAMLQAAAAGVSKPTSEANAVHAATPEARPPDIDPPGSATAAAASDGPRLDVDGLARRLAAAEKRIAALEARLGGQGPGPAPKPGRRRAGRLG